MNTSIQKYIETQREGIPFELDETSDGEIIQSLLDAGTIIRLGEGVYYKPEISEYGLGPIPVSEEDIIEFVTKKYDGYISGPYAFNLLGFTTQCATIICIASPSYHKPISLGSYRFIFMKSHFGYQEGKRNTYLLVLLDAIESPDSIPGEGKKEVLKTARRLIVNLTPEKVDALRRLSRAYKKSVQEFVSTVLKDNPRARHALNLLSPDYEPTDEELEAIMAAAAREAEKRNKEAHRKLFEEIKHVIDEQ